MFRVSLVNMPFTSVTMPSLALTQLKSMLEDHFKDQISLLRLTPRLHRVCNLG